MSYDDWIRIPESERLEGANAFFGGGHDVIISKRHFVEGAEVNNELADISHSSRRPSTRCT